MRFQYRTGANAATPFRHATGAAWPCRVAARQAAVSPALPAARRRRHAGPLYGAIGGAVLLAMAGCAALDADLAKVFRVEPVLSVTHAISSSPAYYTLGRYHDAEQAWDKAIDAYRKAVIIDTQHIEAYNALGVALAHSGRYAEAEATLRQALVIAPTRAHVRSNLGFVLMLAGKPTEAAAELALAVKQDPGDTTASANLGQAMAQVAAAQVAVAQAAAQGAAAQTPAALVEASGAPTIARLSLTSDVQVTGYVPVQQPMASSDQTPISAPQAAVATAVPVLSALPSPPITSGAAHSAKPSPAQPVSRLEVSNGNGVAGMAARVGRWLAAEGLRNARLTNQRPFVQATTLVEYRSGHELNAQRVARSLPITAATAAAPSPGLTSDVRVLLGRDWALAAACQDDPSCRPVHLVLASAR